MDSCYFQKFGRKPVQLIDPKKDKLQFQHIDISYHIVKYFVDHNLSTLEPVIRIYGITNFGNSVLTHVHGFYPYFYVRMPRNFKKEQLKNFKTTLNYKLLSILNLQYLKDAVINVEVVKKKNIFGYTEKLFSYFLKITVALPNFLEITSTLFNCKEFNEYGFLSKEGYSVFEHNVDYIVRFMVDKRVVGCSWIELPANKYELRTNPENFVSRCQYEADINWQNFISYPTEDEWSKLAPFRILSFDIECCGRDGIFPEPEFDPVIQIANCCIRQGENQPFLRVIFCLKKVLPISEQNVLCFDTESELLRAWSNFIREVDCDFITGYNIQNFDLNYLIKRAFVLNVKDFPYLGRLKCKKTKVRKKEYKHQKYEINLEGICLFDVYLVLKRDYKFSSYSLNYVAGQIINQQKIDIKYSEISKLQNDGIIGRTNLANYCCKDALLPLQLIEKLNCLYNYIEIARITAIPFSYLLNDFESNKIISQILRVAEKKNLIIPHIIQQQCDQFFKTLNIGPKSVYCHVPFSSLDSQCIQPEHFIKQYLSFHEKNFKEYLIIENTIVKFILQEILEDFLHHQKKYKLLFQNEIDESKLKLINVKQIVLKICINDLIKFIKNLFENVNIKQKSPLKRCQPFEQEILGSVDKDNIKTKKINFNNLYR